MVVEPKVTARFIHEAMRPSSAPNHHERYALRSSFIETRQVCKAHFLAIAPRHVRLRYRTIKFHAVNVLELNYVEIVFMLVAIAFLSKTAHFTLHHIIIRIARLPV